MIKTVISRVIELATVVLVVSTILFFLMRLSGDPVLVIAGPNPTPALVESIREEYGFNQPLFVQYGNFLAKATSLDFGESYQFLRPATAVVLERLPNTMLLTATALLLALLLAIPAGVLAASSRNPLVANLFMGVTLLGQSMPAFWLGLLLILLFAVNLGWLPSFGASSALHLILPSITLAAFVMAKYARLVRSSLLEVLKQDYIRSAVAKGVAGRIVLYKHALRNALGPLISTVSVDVGVLMGGAVITETIFSWPGMGRLLVTSVLFRDYPVVQTIVFLVAFIVFFAGFLVDVLYRVLDPRLRGA